MRVHNTYIQEVIQQVSYIEDDRRKKNLNLSLKIWFFFFFPVLQSIAFCSTRDAGQNFSWVKKTPFKTDDLEL